MLEKGDEMMMKKESGFSPVVIILSVALILALGGVGYFYLQSQKTAKDAPPQKEAPTPLVAQPPADQMVYKIFNSTDNKFSFDYPSSWTQIDIKNLESMIPKEMIDKNELTMPLLLTDPTGGRLVLTTYSFDKKMDLDQVMDEMKADSAKMGAPYEEIDRKMVGNSLVVNYKLRTGGIVMRGRDLVFLSAGQIKNDIYVVSLAATEKTWNNFDIIFTHVQSSAKLI
ncbi:MAG: hypothetical protein Q8Q86_02915 [Candidatus Daviesbacteria bacterium]|nr:hypothetical protein [Candidatus Daviesbacteria bacterium]